MSEITPKLITAIRAVTPPPPPPTYLYALMSLDLNEHGPGRPVTEQQRAEFNDKLATNPTKGWTKITDLGTVWYCRFTTEQTQTQIEVFTKQCVAEAAKHAGIKNYKVAVCGSRHSPIIFAQP